MRSLRFSVVVLVSPELVAEQRHAESAVEWGCYDASHSHVGWLQACGLVWMGEGLLVQVMWRLSGGGVLYTDEGKVKLASARKKRILTE